MIPLGCLSIDATFVDIVPTFGSPIFHYLLFILIIFLFTKLSPICCVPGRHKDHSVSTRANSLLVIHQLSWRFALPESLFFSQMDTCKITGNTFQSLNRQTSENINLIAFCFLSESFIQEIRRKIFLKKKSI